MFGKSDACTLAVKEEFNIRRRDEIEQVASHSRYCCEPTQTAEFLRKVADVFPPSRRNLALSQDLMIEDLYWFQWFRIRRVAAKPKSFSIKKYFRENFGTSN